MPLPERLTTPITIWCRWTAPDGLVHSLRRVLQGCTWRERDISTALTTGTVLSKPTIIRVFHATSGLVYAPPHEFAAMADPTGYWTCDLTLAAKPLMVPFASEQEFSPGTTAAVTTAENNYMKITPGAVRAAQRNDNSKGMGSHIFISA